VELPECLTGRGNDEMLIHIVAEAAAITTANATAIKTAIETAGLSTTVMEMYNSGFLVLKVV
jgi:hypothetical protein